MSVHNIPTLLKIKAYNDSGPGRDIKIYYEDKN